MKNEKNTNVLDYFAKNAASPELLAALRYYEEARAAKGKPIKTEHARELILKKLQRFAPGDIPGQIMILERSIENSWTGIFPLPADYRGERKAATADYENSSFDTDEFFAAALKKSYEKMRNEAGEDGGGNTDTEDGKAIDSI